MTDEEIEGSDLEEMSDKEIEELSDELSETIPEALSKGLGRDISEIGEEEQQEFSEQMKDILTDFREAYTKDSEEEQAVAVLDAHNRILEEQMMGPEENEEFDSGYAFLVEQLRSTLEDTREGLEELGYVEYFDLMNGFAVDIVEGGRASEVKEFFDSLENDSQQMMLQRMMSPILTQYLDYMADHQEVSEVEEVQEYTGIYYELSEFTGNFLPQFIAVLQISSGREETYQDLKEMGLNNLLQKLESKKYGRFNDLAQGIDRKIRNSIAHRDFKIDPVENEIEFHDRGELVAELSYSEFQNETFHLLALVQSLWIFQVMVSYYQIQNLPGVLDELKEE